MNEELEAVEKYIDMIIEFGVKYGFQVVANYCCLETLSTRRWASRRPSLGERFFKA
jgi:hypothetical protein